LLELSQVLDYEDVLVRIGPMMDSDVEVQAFLMEDFLSFVSYQLEVSVRPAISLKGVPSDEAQVLLVPDPILSDEIVFDGRLLAIDSLEQVCI
jgi:hypothetical protein